MAQKKERLKIGIITCPLGEMPDSNHFVIELIKLLEPFSQELYVLTSNYYLTQSEPAHLHIRNLTYDSKKQPLWIRIFKQVLWHLRLTVELTKISPQIDIVVFYIGSRSYLLPLLVAKLRGKKIVSIVTGSGPQSMRAAYADTLYGYGGAIFSMVYKILESINYRLADLIIAESPGIITFVGLQRFKSKIRYSGIYFDTKLFSSQRDFQARSNLVGYIGRISAEKGITNFIAAIPLILEQRQDVRFFIGGEGVLLSQIKGDVENLKITSQVTFGGWINHAQLPRYYSDFKLLVVPSYTESVPIVAVEAMACETIVLATPVGGIPDVIVDGQNGFILKDNTPPSIAGSVLNILSLNRLPEIASAAKATIDKGFTYAAATQKYREIFAEVAR